jgi:lipoyl-dependent peroxiredoxin
MKRSASAVWKGGLKDGRGTVSTETGTVSNVPYTFRMRFENEKGTNPEELIAAAHAACFSMALSLFMANEGLTPESIETTCAVNFENVDGAWTVTESHLQTKVKSSNADPAKFQKAADGAKAGCPISRLLNTKITMDARLV